MTTRYLIPFIFLLFSFLFASCSPRSVCEPNSDRKCVGALCITQVVAEISGENLIIHFELDTSPRMPSNSILGLKIIGSSGDRWLGGLSNISSVDWVCSNVTDAPYTVDHPANLCGYPIPISSLMDEIKLGETIEVELVSGSDSNSWKTTACTAPREQFPSLKPANNSYTAHIQGVTHDDQI